AQGGEVFVPKIPSYRITDVAEAVGPECEHPVVGIRPGEKVHEEMITVSDSLNTLDLGPYFAILPTENSLLRDHYLGMGARPVPQGFSYNSGENADFLSVEKLRELIVSHVDSAF